MRQSHIRAIERRDAIARSKRQQAELIELAERYYGSQEGSSAPEGVDPYHYSRSITGIPSPGNAAHKGTESCWYTRYALVTTDDGKTHARKVGRVRTVGGDITVIHADGTTETREPGSFRAQRATSKRSAKVQNEQQARRIMINDPRFGNHTELASGDA